MYCDEYKKREIWFNVVYGFAISVVGAALRLGILQHYDGQRINS